MISLPEFSSNTNPKWPVIVVFLNSSGVVWTEPVEAKGMYIADDLQHLIRAVEVKH